MNELEKVLLGGGMLATTKAAECAPWRGMENPKQPLFNAAQAAENRHLYPHLFRGDR